jgi:hypothetical protein
LGKDQRQSVMNHYDIDLNTQRKGQDNAESFNPKHYEHEIHFNHPADEYSVPSYSNMNDSILPKQPTPTTLINRRKESQERYKQELDQQIQFKKEQEALIRKQDLSKEEVMYNNFVKSARENNQGLGRGLRQPHSNQHPQTEANYYPHSNMDNHNQLKSYDEYVDKLDRRYDKRYAEVYSSPPKPHNNQNDGINKKKAAALQQKLALEQQIAEKKRRKDEEKRQEQLEDAKRIAMAEAEKREADEKLKRDKLQLQQGNQREVQQRYELESMNRKSQARMSQGYGSDQISDPRLSSHIEEKHTAWNEERRDQFVHQHALEPTSYPDTYSNVSNQYQPPPRGAAYANPNPSYVYPPERLPYQNHHYPYPSENPSYPPYPNIPEANVNAYAYYREPYDAANPSLPNYNQNSPIKPKMNYDSPPRRADMNIISAQYPQVIQRSDTHENYSSPPRQANMPAQPHLGLGSELGYNVNDIISPSKGNLSPNKARNRLISDVYGSHYQHGMAMDNATAQKWLPSGRHDSNSR